MSSVYKCFVMTSNHTVEGISLGVDHVVEAADVSPLHLEKKTMYVIYLLIACELSYHHPRRRVDLRLLPLFGLLYAIAVIDKANLGVAREVGMGVDLVGLAHISFNSRSIDTLAYLGMFRN
jgi:hypothetical protein